MSNRLDLLTVYEVATELHVHPDTVRRWLARGDLVGRKVGRHWRVTLADLKAFAAGERLAA
jgi:excisionase family DNA binding protein